jgi:hypothetical protein
MCALSSGAPRPAYDLYRHFGSTHVESGTFLADSGLTIHLKEHFLSVSTSDNAVQHAGSGVAPRRRATEAKSGYKTTEFFVYLLAVAAVALTALVVGGDADNADPFNAEQALWFITLLSIGYLVSRGLAKAGSPSRDDV